MRAERAARELQHRGRRVLDLDRMKPCAAPARRPAATGPNIHSRRSTVWMAWFISAPPPSSAAVPRQREPL